ncbi:hypothetical protein CFIMG_007774RA00001 [Ceratocystis fimbriata CBS 114723]|uniref:Uncharacterized protein n=1 Tax=Ceratocystis fimbriata CBS 114723 TaxID=1035309 RepID=A0A2C5XAR2_9PEZI|nr:hypothetical protein CFIMG_007774RA00001 [Ceratocystis fimbriata CBS 114723]
MPSTSAATRLPGRARTQSLRKPANIPKTTSTDAAPETDRHKTTKVAASHALSASSPSRLPLKPTSRAAAAGSDTPPSSSSFPSTYRTTNSRPPVTSGLRTGLRHPTPSTGISSDSNPDDIPSVNKRCPPSSKPALASNAQSPSYSASQRTSTIVHRRAKSVVTTPSDHSSLRPTPASTSLSSVPATKKSAPSVHVTTKPRSMSHHSTVPSLATSTVAGRNLAIGSTLLSRKHTSAATGTDTSSSDRNPSATTAAPKAPTSSATTTLRSRPAFNTLQQHYSPLKNPVSKPSMSTYTTSPSPTKLSSNANLCVETSRHQNELLLLHILHRDSAGANESWRESAFQILSDRFHRMRTYSNELSAAETEHADALNIEALITWGASNGYGLETKIQVLDSILLGLWNMSETGGKYIRVVRRFERWAEHMREVEEARNCQDWDTLLREKDVAIIGTLDPSWREECIALGRRLDEWRRNLINMSHSGLSSGYQNPEAQAPPKTSSLQRIMRGFSVLIRDMLTELAIMEQIENEAIRREQKWVDNMLNDTEETCHYQAGAIWRGI